MFEDIIQPKRPKKKSVLVHEQNKMFEEFTEKIAKEIDEEILKSIKEQAKEIPKPKAITIYV